jgi:large subunit ribosomal protein L1
VAIGKVSFDTKSLSENFKTLADAIKKAKPAKSKGVYLRNISLSTTMGPGIKVSVS